MATSMAQLRQLREENEVSRTNPRRDRARRPAFPRAACMPPRVVLPDLSAAGPWLLTVARARRRRSPLPSPRSRRRSTRCAACSLHGIATAPAPAPAPAPAGSLRSISRFTVNLHRRGRACRSGARGRRLWRRASDGCRTRSTRRWCTTRRCARACACALCACARGSRASRPFKKALGCDALTSGGACRAALFPAARERVRQAQYTRQAVDEHRADGIQVQTRSVFCYRALTRSRPSPAIPRGSVSTPPFLPPSAPVYRWLLSASKSKQRLQH